MVRKNPIQRAIAQVSAHNSDTMKMLTVYPPFLEDVANIRKEFGIPEDGFRKQNNEPDFIAAEKWQENMFRESGKLSDTPAQQQISDNLLTQVESGKITFIQYRKQLEEIANSFPEGRWQRVISEELMMRYRLTTNFKQSIQQYIMTSAVIAPQMNFALEAGYTFLGQPELRVIIYGRLTKKEWSALKEEVARTHTRRQPPNIKRARIRINIDEDIAIVRESLKKGSDALVVNDSDIAARIFSDEDDISPKADAMRAKKIKQARFRIQQAQRARFSRG